MTYQYLWAPCKAGAIYADPVSHYCEHISSSLSRGGYLHENNQRAICQLCECVTVIGDGPAR